MKIDGGCHCGSVTFEADVDPEKAGLCHCTDCQTMSGSAFRTVVFTHEGGFKLLSGELKTYVKTAESGTRRPQAFCPECGTPIYSTTLGPDPKVYVLRVGAIRQRAQLVPKLQYWCRSARPWVDAIGSLPRHEMQPVFGKTGGVD